jgi:GNAT superfamily N-acetyltransferase
VLLRTLIVELAEFERETAEIRTTEADLLRDGFDGNPRFRAVIAEWQEKTAGMAVYFPHYSTWRGTGLYVDDLFVRAEFRGRGIGTALLAHIARVAEQEKCAYLRWAVLDWNQLAVDLYQRLGGRFLDDWRTVLLTGDDLRQLARKDLR